MRPPPLLISLLSLALVPCAPFAPPLPALQLSAFARPLFSAAPLPQPASALSEALSEALPSLSPPTSLPPVPALLRRSPLLLLPLLLTPLPSRLLAAVWSSLLSLPLAHSCMFEAYTAAGGFALSIVFFSFLHLLPRLFLRSEEVAALMRRRRLDGQFPVQPFEWLGASGIGRFRQAWVPFFSYLFSVRAFHVFVAKPPLPLHPPSAVRFLFELASGVLLYDCLFSLLHRALHRTPLLRPLHRRHHSCAPEARKGRSLVALETVQHSFPDAFLQVAANVLVQRLALFPILLPAGAALLPKHPLSRVAHNLLVTYLLAESHSGYDFPWQSHNVFPRVFGGAPDHERHHREGEGNYYQFFRFLGGRRTA
ncbi:hypothetical protein TeGR_g5493 [Tetraparma gracilis]|uniref:Fatty acid hydroxylase domain-containing protein n=1 Tax=Tetraparma gracilis TaxID=2962635 RepID=A0ABQ6MFB9_9STRA|nr:hypothetical protein TeGR_g5493 [Tetraparma gracilis]